jgi:hypothetical protein
VAVGFQATCGATNFKGVCLLAPMEQRGLKPREQVPAFQGVACWVMEQGGAWSSEPLCVEGSGTYLQSKEE